MKQPRVWCLSHTQKSALSTVRCLTASAVFIKSRSEDDKGCCGNRVNVTIPHCTVANEH